MLTFVDDRGLCWRVWHVETPAASAHLLDASFRTGWLVFEREDEQERRRLSQVPDGWASLSPERLALLCEVAIPVPVIQTGHTGQRPGSVRQR